MISIWLSLVTESHAAVNWPISRINHMTQFRDIPRCKCQISGKVGKIAQNAKKHLSAVLK